MPGVQLGGPVARGHHPSLLLEGLREIFGDEYPVHDMGTVEALYVVKGSRKDREKHVVRSGTGVAFPASEGGSPVYDAMQEVWDKTVYHVIYKLGLEFTREAVEDNLYLDIADDAGKQLAQSMAYTRQLFCMSPFNDLTEAIYTANSTDYTLLSTTHFRIDGGTWSNTVATPTGLSLAALETLLQQWNSGMLNQRGFKYNFKPALLHVSAAHQILAGRLLDTEKRPTTNMNDNNIVRSDWNLNRFVNVHLNEDGRFFLHAPKAQTGARFYDRVKADIDPYDGGDTGNRKFVAYARYSKAIPYPSGIAGSAGS